MPTTINSDHHLWSRITEQVRREWDALPEDERAWISRHAERLAALQEELHRLVLAVDGDDICRGCDGDCCGHGRFHPGLANLLILLVRQKPFPDPDFSRGCPYVGDTGCLFPPDSRPFNCITFICDRIEDRLASTRRAQFYRLENLIRREYRLFADRYAGGSLRGLLIRGSTLPAYLDRR